MDISFLTNFVNSDTIVTLIISSGGLLGVFHYIMKLIQMFFAHKTLKGIDNYRDVNSALQSLREEAGCSHAIIFRGHDHNALPSLGNPYYISYSYGSAPQLKNLPEGAMRIFKINNVTASPSDINLIYDCATSKLPMLISMDEIDNESIVGEYFKSHNVKNVIIYYIKNINKNIFFLAIAKKGEEGFTYDEFKSEEVKKHLKAIKATFRSKL